MTSEHSLIALLKYAVDSAATMLSVDVSGCALSLVDDGLDTILDGREAGCRIITEMSLNTGNLQPTGRTDRKNDLRQKFKPRQDHYCADTRVGTLIVATICLQLIQNRYMFRSFTVLQCSY